MKRVFILAGLAIGLMACENKAENDELKKVNWERRAVNVSQWDSLLIGKTYLSIYSQIYSISQHKKYNLTAMASLRNTSAKDTVYLFAADYYDTHGKLLKQYINKPVYLAPMETLEIVIDEVDVAGGTGSNFIFDWKTPQDCPEPLFEAVMSSTIGQQGLSFTSQGKRIK